MKISSLKKIMKRTSTEAIAPVPKKTAVKKALVKKAVAKRVSNVVTKKAVVKKSTAAPVVKKTPIKKAVPKKKNPTSKRLVVASDSESFWVTDGQVLNNLPALAQALKKMSASVYTYHATGSGNHFADWVESILADSDCAALIRNAKTAKRAALIIETQLKSYEI